MSEFAHERHKPLATLARPRELVIACALAHQRQPLAHRPRRGLRGRAQDHLLRPCPGRQQNRPRQPAPENPAGLTLDVHRTLPPALARLREEGYRLVGLEQTTGSHCLYTFPFERRTALVVGNERQGLEDDVLRLLDHVVEIPVYGLPYAHNVATATAMALYEYCRQFPEG